MPIYDKFAEKAIQSKHCLQFLSMKKHLILIGKESFN